MTKEEKEVIDRIRRRITRVEDALQEDREIQNAVAILMHIESDCAELITALEGTN